ncbi:MAG: hypothetical protein ABIU09_06455 [Pyrinomonadaceae bacterium]
MLTVLLSIFLFSSIAIYGVENEPHFPTSRQHQAIEIQKPFFSGVFTYLGDMLFGRQASAPAQAVHNLNLSKAVVSKVSDENIIVTMEASGDMRGSLTFILNRDVANNTIVSGDWSLVNSFIQDLPASGGSFSDSDGGGGEQLINNGTLHGGVTGGTISFNEDGTVASVDGLQLNIVSGSLTYSEVLAGGGTANGAGLNDIQTSSGTLTLNF